MKSTMPSNEHEKQSSYLPIPNQPNLQTYRESHENFFNTSIRAPFLSTAHQNSSSSSTFLNAPVRPPFQTTINQNSMSSSSFLNTHVRPPFQTTLYENPASRSSSTHSQSLQSHPVQYQPTLYQTFASSSSLLDNEQDEVNEVDEVDEDDEDDEVDEDEEVDDYEMKLLHEVEIIGMLVYLMHK